MEKTPVLTFVVLLFFASAVILSSTPAGVEAQSVGVKVGDWVKYNISGNFSGLSSFDWMRIEFTKVEGTSVTVKATVHMTNGMETSQDMSFVIGSPEGGLAGVGFVIPANLGLEDTVSFSGTDVKLTTQTTRTYGGTSRTVVGIDYSMPGLVSAAVFWDKTTGMLLEASMSFEGQSLGIIASSTSFGGDLFGSWWIWVVITAAIVGPIAALAFIMNRRRSMNPPSPIAEPQSASA